MAENKKAKKEEPVEEKVEAPVGEQGGSSHLLDYSYDTKH